MGKGQRRERQCKAIYEAAGFAVAHPERAKFGDNDLFNQFDLLAMQPARRPRFVQVKSNRATGIRTMQHDLPEFFAFGFCMAEYAVAHDNEGWRLIAVLPDTTETLYDEREQDCSMGEGLTQYLS
jgi:Holliday junction resolvase